MSPAFQEFLLWFPAVVIALTVHEFAHAFVADRLGEITCPALVVHGEVDAAIPIERGREMADNLGGPTTFVEVPGAGHSSNLENAATVNVALLQFLGELG